MSFAKFLHSLLQIFIETDYFLKIKKGEKAQLPSTITFILQKLPENEGEKGRDKSKEREKTSKCIWEEGDEDHFTESQAIMTLAGNMRSIC